MKRRSAILLVLFAALPLLLGCARHEADPFVGSWISTDSSGYRLEVSCDAGRLQVKEITPADDDDGTPAQAQTYPAKVEKGFLEVQDEDAPRSYTLNDATGHLVRSDNILSFKKVGS